MPPVDRPDWPAQMLLFESGRDEEPKPRRRWPPLGRKACQRAAEILLEGWNGDPGEIERLTDLLFQFCVRGGIRRARDPLETGIIPFGSPGAAEWLKEQQGERARQDEEKRAARKRAHEEREWSE